MAKIFFCLVVSSGMPLPRAAVAGERALSAYKQQLILKGEWYFERHCTFCHGKDGAGLVGPNLTDWYFIYGSDRATMERVITEGLPEKGMPVWSTLMPADQLSAIKEYVWSLRGKNLPGKAPEGKFLDQKPAETDG